MTCNDVHQSECVSLLDTAETRKDKELAIESSKMRDSSVGLDSNTPRDEWMGVHKDKSGQLSGGTGKDVVTKDENRGEKENRSEKGRVSPESRPHIQPGPPQPLEGMDD